MRTAPDDFRTRAADDPASLLVLIMDVSASAWSEMTNLPSNQVSHEAATALQSVTEQLLVYINSFLLLHDSNRICVILAAPNGAQLVYPIQVDPDAVSFNHDLVQEDRIIDIGSGSYGLTQQVDQVAISLRDAVTQGIKESIQLQEQEQNGDPSLISTALAKALCVHNRARRIKAARKVVSNGSGIESGDVDDEQYNGRILMVLAGEDVPIQYVPVMNCIFSAQRMGVAIDTCALSQNKDSTYFQQAAHLTNGVYMRPEGFSTKTPNALVQFLQTVFLIDRQSRDFLAMPTPEKVDFRASCMQTRETIEDGYTCSVCLSTFAMAVGKGAALCPICGARFAVMPRGKRPPKPS